MNIEKSLTIEKAIKGDNFSKLSKLYGDKPIIKALDAYAEISLEYFNVSQPLTQVQRFQTMYLIFGEYPETTLEDIILMFKKVKLAEFGQIKYKIDCTDIMNWWQQYLLQRADAFEEMKHNEKIQVTDRLKQDFVNIKIYDQIKIQTENKNEFKPDTDEVKKPYLPLGTNEMRIAYLKQHIDEIPKDKLELLLKDYQNKNVRGSNNEVIELIKDKLIIGC